MVSKRSFHMGSEDSSKEMQPLLLPLTNQVVINVGVANFSFVNCLGLPIALVLFFIVDMFCPTFWNSVSSARGSRAGKVL